MSAPESFQPSPEAHDARVAFHLAGARVDGATVPVAVIGPDVVALSALGATFPDHVHELFDDWAHWGPRLTAAIADRPDDLPLTTPEGWAVPVRPSKLVCAGVNYRDHLREMGTEHGPEQPYCFLKPVLNGFSSSGASVPLPGGPEMVDWEAELAIVIGGRLRGVSGAAVLDAVAGYTILNDLSARDWIKRTRPPGIDWVLMKAYDGFSPIGPFVTPREFVADPQDLAIRLWVNGELRQESNTSEMIFGVQALLEHLSNIMTLEPGDVIATGTPAGVGFGRRPQQFLGAGDTVAVEIDGLGRLETHLVASTQGATP